MLGSVFGVCGKNVYSEGGEKKEREKTLQYHLKKNNTKGTD
jgi:hypothetical protein